MVNWYVPLYLGVIFILFIFEHIGSSKRIIDYIAGTKGPLGLSWGTNLLLARIISCETILFSIIAVEYFGFLGGVLLITIEFISLVIVYHIILKINNNNNNFGEHHDYVGVIKLSLKNPVFSIITTVLYFFSNIFLQLYILRLLLGSIVEDYQFAAIFSVCLVSFISVGLGGFNALCKGARPLVIFIYFSITVITISIFLEKGLLNTYNNLYALPILISHEINVFIIIIAAIIWRISYYILDNSLWHIIRQIKPHRLKTVFPVSLLCLLTIPLAISSLTIFSKSLGFNYTNSFNISFILMKSPLLLTLYICLIFVIAISTTATNLHGLISLFLIYKPQDLTPLCSDAQRIIRGYIGGLFVIIACLFISLHLNLSLLSFLNLTGLLYVSLSVPFILFLLDNSNPNTNFFVSFLSLLVGTLFYFKGYDFSFITSFFIAIIISLGIGSMNKLKKIL